MADKIRMIDVPEVEPEAYNHDRPISGLIHMQLVHLSAAEQTMPPAQRTGVNIAMLHTEREAAEYIQKVTAMLHRLGKSKKKVANKNRASKKKRPVAGKVRPVVKKAAAKSGKGRNAGKSRR